ncbi:accessory gene regulator B family protein [Serpentinicella sp. ANB-PHB4]|uniref:accessory gene regulator ArgB-like protein n=1 Tax=Serpentinicella sp. ANB-PHB4 TaxID=3074076 RepID=UPI00285F9015|nr:accessory gene regulator B family protein [Serpentinicella sp. ANB-PHB4]MDR5659174.1 accessory gene regulator B family protein [Serpentinicella sp. ANB-PHB4]
MSLKFIEKVSREKGLEKEDLEVLQFGYKLLIGSILGYLAILVPAYLFGTLTAVFSATITTSLFRVTSGGAHAKSQKQCIIFGMIIFNAIGSAAVYTSTMMNVGHVWVLFISTIVIATISLYLFAPADTPGKPISEKAQKSKLRFLSFSFLLIWVVILGLGFKGDYFNHQLVVASCFGLLWQSISLWPITYRFFGY